MNKKVLSIFAVATSFVVLAPIAGASVSASSYSKISEIKVIKAGKEEIIQGTVQRNKPMHQTIGGHVHVTLIGKGGEVLGTGTCNLAPMSPRRDVSRNHRSTYSATFPEGTVGKADKVRVVFVENPHGSCGTTNSKGA